MSDELYHYGLKGMKWGQRRWQYEDGRFNAAGKQRYFGQNSPHRPDSVRVLQGDKPKGSANSPKKEFDKEHAKQVAKNVAIGAAVVGGTVLVAYGGYKLHQAGGFSGVSKNLTTKMRETKLENLKLKNEYKAEVAKIKTEGKEGLAKIREKAKSDFTKIREEGKLERKMIGLDPEGRIDQNVLKELSYGSSDQKWLKDKLRTLDSKEVEALNSGKVKLSDLQGRRARDLDPHQNIGKSIMDASRHSKEFNSEYDSWLNNLSSGKATRDDRPIPDAGHLMDNPVTKDWWMNRGASSNSSALRNAGSNAINKAKKAGSKVVKAATSDATKSAVKSAGSKIKKAGSEAAKAATSDTAKAAYKKAGSTAVKAAKAGGKATAKAAKSTAQIVSEYRKQHPNTRMSPQQIVKSVSGKSSGSTGRSRSRLTLTPDTINAGANFLGQATKSYVTLKQVNQQNSNNKRAKKGQKAVDNYTQQLLGRGA